MVLGRKLERKRVLSAIRRALKRRTLKVQLIKSLKRAEYIGLVRTVVL